VVLPVSPSARSGWDGGATRTTGCPLVILSHGGQHGLVDRDAEELQACERGSDARLNSRGDGHQGRFFAAFSCNGRLLHQMHSAPFIPGVFPAHFLFCYFPTRGPASDFPRLYFLISVFSGEAMTNVPRKSLSSRCRVRFYRWTEDSVDIPCEASG